MTASWTWAFDRCGRGCRASQAHAAETLDSWEAAHRARIDELLREKGFSG